MANRKILVVEDDPSSLQFIQYNLETAGYQVITAENGVEGLRLIRDEMPDLVISDIMMPKMSGYEMCHQMKNESELSCIPLVFLSAKSLVSDRIRGLEMGAQEFIVKPFNPEELIARIEVILRRNEQEKKSKTRDKSEGVRGSLSEMDMTDILQMLKLGNKTGVLMITDDEYVGEIYLENGIPYKAQAGVVQNEEAIYRMLTWTKGKFIFEPKAINIPNQMDMSLENILLEGSRLSDELKTLQNMLPKTENNFQVNPLSEMGTWSPDFTEEHIINLAELGLNWGKIKELSVLGDYKTAKTIINLLFSGMIEENVDEQSTSITRDISSSIRELFKLTIQLERHNTKQSYEIITVNELYDKLKYQNKSSNVFSTHVLFTEESLINNFFNTLSDSQVKLNNKKIHLGTVNTTDYILYLIGVPVNKHYKSLHNVLVRLSAGKLILINGQHWSSQLSQIENIIFDQHNREHTRVLVKTDIETSPPDIEEKINLHLLKSEDVNIKTSKYTKPDKDVLIKSIKDILYSFIPRKKQ